VKYFEYLKPSQQPTSQPRGGQPRQSCRGQGRKRRSPKKQKQVVERLSQGNSSVGRAVRTDSAKDLPRKDQYALKVLRHEVLAEHRHHQEQQKQEEHLRAVGELKRDFLIGKPAQEKLVSLENSEYNLRYLAAQSQNLQRELERENAQFETKDLIELGKMYSSMDQNECTQSSASGFRRP